MLAAAVVLAVIVALQHTGNMGGSESLTLVAFFVVALLYGVLMTLPIGGADMPVVISLYNALTGLAVGFEGYVLGNGALIIAGIVVGAAGTLLTQLMAKAMNRSIGNVLFAGFGATGGQELAGVEGTMKESTPTTRPSPSPSRRRSSSCPATAWRSRRPSTRSGSWPSCSPTAASRSSSPSTRWRAACPGT